MRVLVGLLIVFNFVTAASAQQSVTRPPQPPIRPDDADKYCVYGNALFSNGAEVCPGRGGPPMICKAGDKGKLPYWTAEGAKASCS